MRDTARLTLVGGPTVLVEIGGFRIITDPTFDEPGHYHLPHVVLEKRTGPAVSAAEIGAVDAVLLSHDQHADNFDHGGHAFLSQARTTFTTQAGAARLGGAVQGLAPWETQEMAGANGKLFVTATPARHGPVGIEPLSGDVVGFLIGRDEPGDTIYVTGDTVWYEGVAEVARRYRPKLVLLFTGAAKTRGAVHLTMDANDALEAAQAFPDALIVPVHNEGWAHFTEDRDALAAAFATLGFADRLRLIDRGVPAEIELGSVSAAAGAAAAG